MPQAPDPTVTAAAQSSANTNTAAAQSALNNVSQYGPYGSSVFNQSGSYTNGAGDTVPTYSETTSLNPGAQAIYSGELQTGQNLVPTAEQLATNAGTSALTPLNFNTADSGILNSAPQQLDQTAANAVYNEQAGFLNPQWNTSQTQLQDQLSRQGIPVGSDAYNNAMTNFNNSKTQAYQSAQNSATAQGSQSAANLFNMALTGQQQNLSQQQLAQSNPLSLLQQLYGSQPNTPTQTAATPSTTNVAPTDVVGATTASGQLANQQYQSQLSANNAQFGGLAGLAGTGLQAAALYNGLGAAGYTSPFAATALSGGSDAATTALMAAIAA